MTFTDEEGYPRQFTWRTIQTWYSRYQKHGVTVMENQPWEGEPPSSTLCDWLGELAAPARILFASSQRLVQEHMGWEFLQQQHL